jgi:uncharacterized protein
MDTLRNEVMSPDVTWHIPGSNTLSGDHRGADATFAFI